MDAFIAFNNPFARPLHMLGIEILVIGAFALTLRDAIARARAGERHALFQWLAAFFYGVFMELIAFNFLDNYEHAHFTVELYHHKLPLYVACLYPMFHYVGWSVVERLRLGPVREALLVGFAICLVDVPFDVAGVAAGWWRWSSTDPVLAVRWLGVPVTSYEWYLIFGAVYALIGRAMRARVEARAGWLAVTPVAGIGVIVLGVIAFLPFHGLRALGVPAEVIVAAHLGACALLAIASAPADARPAARAIAAIPVALSIFHLGVLLVLVAEGRLPRAAVAFAAAAAATIGSVFLAFPALRRILRGDAPRLKEV